MITLLKSKIHRATVTEANLDYIGSVTIDEFLMLTLDIVRHEQVHVWNITNGNRIITYAMEGQENSGVICINGAGAHLFSPGDLIIISTFVSMTKLEAKEHKPKIALIKSPDNTEFIMFEEDGIDESISRSGEAYS
jgi:aspartate 1-decarboxylase